MSADEANRLKRLIAFTRDVAGTLKPAKDRLSAYINEPVIREQNSQFTTVWCLESALERAIASLYEAGEFAGTLMEAEKAGAANGDST